ncbi:MAG: TIGR03086 family metal-binding protein [Actinobacteria bacterium]|nr:TIGR03086 family metal-binding protein [Actinomycetota bacterium]MCL5445169.1 TIGR03086 family metal-binding protein [Actinomycetota bacterium]
MSTNDRRPQLFQSYLLAEKTVAGVSSDQLELPTPCHEYNVAGLVDHIVGVGWRVVALGEGKAPTGDDFPHVDIAEAPKELHSAEEQARAGWSNDERLAAEVTMPWGETYTGSTLVDMYIAEFAAHAWDLATATGQLISVDDNLAAVALEGARSFLKPEYRNLIAPGSPYGSEVEPPENADDWERLVAFMGRNPRPSDRRP